MKISFNFFLVLLPLFYLSQTADDNFKMEIYKKYIDKTREADNYGIKYQKLIDSALVFLPNDADLWAKKSVPYFKKKKYEVGMAFLDKAVLLDEKNNIAYRAFIKCIFSKNYKESIIDFERAKLLIGDDGIIMDHSFDFYIGLCYLQLDNYQQADFFLKKSINSEIKRIGGNGNYLENFYLGIVYYETEKYNDAIIYFDKSLSDYKHFSDAKFYKVRCLNYLHKDYLSLLIESRNDNTSGYTINEGNSIYEEYPYQIRLLFINLILDAITKNKK